MSELEFKKEYLGEWITHDENSCNALKEYDRQADYVSSPYKFMQEVANKYETTIEDMKKHWRCIPLDEHERKGLRNK